MNNAIINFPVPANEPVKAMNKFVLLTVYSCLGLLVLSCSSEKIEDAVFHKEGEGLVSSIGRISKLSLSDIESFIQERGLNNQTKNSCQYQIEPIISNQDTVMYLVNYDEGWELISADLRTEPVLMHCENGNVTSRELFSNPARSFVLNSMTEYMDSLVKNPITIDSAIQTKGNPTPPGSYFDSNGRYWVLAYRYLAHRSTQVQEPLTGLKWGYGSLTSTSSYNWNVSMPYRSSSLTYHCVAGCGPVAAAQTLVYLHNKNGVPANCYKAGASSAYVSSSNPTIYLNTSNTSFTDYGDNWSLMPSQMYGSTPSQVGAASSLMLMIGLKANTGYTSTDAGTSLVGLRDALSYFGYNCTMAGSYVNVFRNQIYVDKLPIIAGIDVQRIDNGVTSEFGHFVVVEGYKRNVDAYTYVYKNGDNGVFEYQYRQYSFTYEYVAVNWGFDGDGEYSGADVIWNSLGSVLSRSFSGGSDTGTIDCMLYGFSQ